MRSFFGSIRFRVVAIYLGVMVLAFVAVSIIVSGIVSAFLVSARVQEQTSYTERLALEFAPLMESQDIDTLYTRAAEKTRSDGGRILVLDCDAVVQMDTASKYNAYFYPSRAVRDILASGAASSYSFHKLARTNTASGSSTEWVAYYTCSVMSENVLLGVVLYSESIQDVVDSVGTVNRQITITFTVFAAVVALISMVIAGWLTKPILTLTNAIRRVGMQGYGERVPVRGTDELAQLSEAFNLMSEKLESHDRTRNEFVSNASHELKTPLSSMKILSEAMVYEENPDPATTKEFFEDINHEVDRLTQIVNDLLRLVHEENAVDALQFTRVDMEELINRVLKRFMPLAKNKGIRLERKLVPLVIDADASRIEQVVSNLVDNALKYTDKGGISVTLKPDGAYAVIVVRDTGIGIPKESVSRLFERFYRVDKARSRETGGTGLGLSIVERIISMHGGYISVESVVGRGSTFTVRLPITQRSPGNTAGGEQHEA
ncbi:HAMP domain-containing histidine kinase [Christensenellaceae bacterium OttesenSCG-928-L17]|nr:HAMP domain-containing histidine kinase [Christensenellaceae bacterium OttesenSCG-928-L17]